MATKADKLTVEQRVEAVYRLILDGWTVEQICQNMSKSFRVSDRQVYRYIDAAWERIKAVNEVELSEHKRRAVAAHYQMLREAKTVKEKATVWAALSRLLGLDAPKAVEVSGRNGEALQVEHRGKVHGSVEHVAAVWETLVEVGAVQLTDDDPAGNAEDDAIHNRDADA